MMNQGDYPRTIGFMLGSPIDVAPYDGRGAPAFLWPYVRHIASPFLANSSASVYFWILAKVQSLVESNFDLYLAAFISKVLILCCCLATTVLFCYHQQLSRRALFFVFPAFALAFFYGHNIAFINSLYAEHAFVVGVALMMTGLLDRKKWRRICLVSGGLLLSAASKPQYFYMPLLLGAAITIVALLGRKRLDVWLLLAIGAVQIVSALPLLNVSTKQVNYYHSLYFGSYKMLSTEQLQTVGLRPGTIGVSGWIGGSGRWLDLARPN